MRKKLRKEFFHFEPEDKTLKIWDPYLRISIVKPKVTFTGFHDTKIMISIGRRFNEEKAEEFFKSKDPTKEEIMKRFAKEMNQPLEKVISLAKAGMLKNMLLKIWKVSAEKLGIPVIIPEKDRYFEIFEYIKLKNPDEVIMLIHGLLIALGASIALFVDKSQKEIVKDYYKYHIQNVYEKFVKRGMEIGESICDELQSHY